MSHDKLWQQSLTVAKSLTVAIAFVLMSVAATANAGMIDFSAGAVIVNGPGIGNVALPVAITPNPNNDNQDGSSPAVDKNITVPIKRFDNPGYIDIVFPVSNTDGVSEYVVFENVDNNTGVDWVGYTLQLGSGIGASFAPSTAGDGLDFDAPGHDPAASFFSTTFANLAIPSEDELVFSGGTQGPGSQNYSFRIDVPDLDSFTIRQLPSPVPEPTSLAAFATAFLIGFAIRRRWIFA